ncbi:MAG: PLP-dependent aminotransferase family protein [Aureispira sp.]|nr:PLP-dependent aminotransferase family protein [Aureispira sp.]
MLPYKNLIVIDRNSRQAIYLQVVDGFIQLIKSGQLHADNRLPSSRKLAELLMVHRNTITTAYEELEAQGWVNIQAQKGVYVHTNMPKINPQALGLADESSFHTPNYKFVQHSLLDLPKGLPTHQFRLDDGVPDVRLAPLKALGRTYRSLLNRKWALSALDYQDTFGALALRKELAKYLQETRGINLSIDNIMISRGSIMGLYLAIQTLVERGDNIAVGQTSYSTVNMMFRHLGANLYPIPVDQDGIVVAELSKLCENTKIKAIYIASHHHHPTTATLSAERRLELLELARKHQFAILEDDYDYDFHYRRNPILPLASIDRLQQVVYVGSLSKVLAPAFRVGFVVAAKEVIEQMGRFRRIIDRQGDSILEKAIAELFQLGEIQRHIRKSLGIYQERRDVLCSCLKASLGSQISFDKPEGGMAIWARFDKSIDLIKTAQKALKKGLYFSDGQNYAPNANATRLGFASMNEKELEQAVDILKKSIILTK